MARPASPLVERRLAAILHADVQGYSRMIEADEAGTLRILTPYLQLMTELARQHGGHPVGSRGDSLLAEFPSARNAVQGAVAMQQELKKRNAELPAEQQVTFRMGIHVGEITEDGAQLHGDGINIAVRLEGLAEPGGLLISGTVYDQVKNKLALQYEALGEQQLKNIAEPVRVYRVVLEKTDSPQSTIPQSQRSRQKPRWVGTSMSVFVLVVLLGGLATFWALFHSAFRTPHSVLRTQEAQPPSLPLPDKPSIVVLPFVNMSGDPEQEYFSDGITEELTSNLSRLPGLFVIARHSAFTYKGKAARVQAVGQELGVRYVLEGSVRKSNNQVRIIAQLIDATTGYHLWTERYDRELKDLLNLQDEITQQIVANLRVEVRQAELERVRRIPTENLTAYDYGLRGVGLFLRTMIEPQKEMNEQARQMFEKAIELDPTYAAAYVGLGATYHQEWLWQWSRDPQTLERAFALAHKAIALDDSLPQSHQLLASVYQSKKQYDQATVEAERFVALDPNNADGYMFLGNMLVWTERPEEGLGLMEKAMRLNPRYPVWYLERLGAAYRVVGRCEEAIMQMKKVVTLNPNNPPAHFVLVICYVELGRQAEAEAEAAEVLRINPNFSLEVFKQNIPIKDQALLERTITAARKAGLK